MNKRIIAFDGLDCIGKSTVIFSLKDKLLSMDYIPYVIHLNGPVEDLNNILERPNCFDKTMEYAPFFIQWEKFIQTYKMIKVVLDESLRNIIILDRTPYSEQIWTKFFDRNYNKVKNLNNHALCEFMQLFKQLSETICIVNLDVNNNKILHRLFSKDEDYNNYVNAFDKIYKPTTTYTPITDTDSKVLYMINTLKQEFNNMFLFLCKYGIETYTYENNTQEDINNITIDLIEKITKNN